MKKARVVVVLTVCASTILSGCSQQVGAVYVTATPDPANAPGPQVTLYYEEYAQFELISPEGTRILIDVHNPDYLTSPPTEDDILLSTHLHGDHFVDSFADSFPGQELRAEVGEIDNGDVSILSIPSSHGPDEEPRTVGSSNYIYVIDVADMRFVHFGDAGQTEFSQEQLDALGEVDVAMILFGGMCSIDWWNSFGLMEQVQPRLIIPTHAAREVLVDALELWGAYWVDPGEDYYDEVNPAMIGLEDLPDETGFLPLGEWATECRTIDDMIVW